MTTSRSERAGLAFVLCVAAALRLWGLDFGLPQTWSRPDEELVVRPALEYFGGDLNPHVFSYGALPSYLVFAAVAACYGAGRLSGRYAGLDDLRLEYAVDPSLFHLCARGWSAAFGVATVWLAWRIARRWHGGAAGLAAALLLAVSHLHARDSHFGVTDVIQTFFVALAVERAQAWWDGGARAAAVQAGLAAGLAAATKYVGGAALLALLVAVLLRARERGPGARPGAPGSARPGEPWRALLAGSLAAALAFLAAMPFVVLDFATFVEHFAMDYANLQSDAGPFRRSGWISHPTFSLWHGVGPPVLGAAALGAALLAVREPRRALVLLAFPLAYLAITGPGSAVFVRYAIPWTPFCAVLAAGALAALLARLHATGPRAVALALGLALLLGAPSLVLVLRTDAAFARESARELAARWIEANVPQGSVIGQVGGYGRLLLPRVPEARAHGIALFVPWRAGAEARAARAGHDPLRALEGAGYPRCRWRAADATFVCEGRGAIPMPPYVLVSTSPRSPFDQPPPGLAARLASDYEPIWSADTGARDVAADRYDPSDAFYLPFAIEAGVERLGPDMVLYARKGEHGTR